MTETGLGIIHIRGEGMPIHPDELNYKCHCDKCKAHYQRQLEAYNNAYNIKEVKDE